MVSRQDVDIAISAMANFWTLTINKNVAESLRYVFIVLYNNIHITLYQHSELFLSELFEVVSELISFLSELS